MKYSMKKNIFFLLIPILFISSLYSCKKNEKQLFKKANELAFIYLQDFPIDSITISKVEKITPIRYAEIVFEAMEMMENEYRILHREALFNGNAGETEAFEEGMEKITEMKEFCFAGITSNSFDDKKIILYMVQYTSFESDYTETGYFFMTPKFALHELDPFTNNLIR